jgi:hypothetical protein
LFRHTSPAEQIDTWIFRLDHGTFGKDLLAPIIARLLGGTLGSISAGRWLWRDGNRYDLQPVKEFKTYRFTVGHLAVGSERVVASPREVEGILDAL